MTRILITRHGEGEHNLNTEFFMGRSPTARLTPRGLDQARRLGQRLARENPPGRIIASSLVRTVQTAREIAREVGLERIEEEDAFWELSKGEWEGRMPRVPPPDVQREMDADLFGYRYPGGESYREVWLRIGPAFDGWVKRCEGETVLFVLHGDVIRALLYHIIRFPPERIGDWVTDPCALSEFVPIGKRMQILRLNDTAHLPR